MPRFRQILAPLISCLTSEEWKCKLDVGHGPECPVRAGTGTNAVLEVARLTELMCILDVIGPKVCYEREALRFLSD